MRPTVAMLDRRRVALMKAIAPLPVIMLMLIQPATLAADVKPCKVSNINVQRAVDWSRVRFRFFLTFVPNTRIKIANPTSAMMPNHAQWATQLCPYRV